MPLEQVNSAGEVTMLGGNILTNAQGDPISIGVPEPTIIGGMLVTLVASGIYFGKRKLNF